MSAASTTQHIGVMIAGGSGGFMSDLVFNGGLQGGAFGNQQFTMRNMTFNNVGTAIYQANNWGWTYYQININNCGTGLSMNNTFHNALTVGSVTFFDSSITNTPIFVNAAYSGASNSPASVNSLILENIALSNVPVAVQNNGKTSLAGSSGSTTISAWGQGHSYTPSGPNQFQGSFPPNVRPASLINGNGFCYTQSKPSYAGSPVSSFVSARSSGAKGDGKTDDTAALQQAINTAASQGSILFVDAGDYVVTKTILIPPGSQIVGEAFSVIISSGSFFNNVKQPQPVIQIGTAGQTGSIAWSDMIVSTRGQQKGAILFQYNLASSATNPSGLWDVHARIGGFTGSNLQLANCPTTPTSTKVKAACIAAFMTFYVTPKSSGLYLENSWLWTADHDVDDPNQSRITVYSGRGLLVESKGPVWLVGTGVEHHTLYQYQFVSASNVFAGFIQTETPYYQPNPSAPTPWPYDKVYFDPQFPTKNVTVTVNGGQKSIPAADAWGLRVVGSSNILIYGAGLYSFFNNYATTCNALANGVICQNQIVSLEGTNSNVNIYNLDTVGTHYMVTINGNYDAYYGDNINVFPATIALFNS